MRSHAAETLAALAAAATLALTAASAAPRDEIEAAFRKFVAAQNAHDLKAVDELLSASPDFLWIAPGHTVQGRAATLDRFRELFRGPWRVDADWSTFEVVMLDVSTAEIFVHVSTDGGGPARSARMNLIMVGTPHGWRVASILPGDA